MLRRLPSLGAVAVAFGLLATMPQGHAAMDPGAFVGTLGNEGIQTLGGPPAQRAARFRQLLQADFDVSGIGRFAIGRYWQAFTPEQQQEFLGLYQESTAQVYAEKLGQYSGAQFRVTGTQPSEGGVVVSSEVTRANGPPVQIDWHLIDQGGGYKVSDVSVDRVSMKVTQRDEFAKIIQNNGGHPTALLAVLRQQISGGEKPAQVPPAR